MSRRASDPEPGCARSLEIIVKTTDACNARCQYCSAGSHPGRHRRLSSSLADRIVDQAAGLVEAGSVGHVRILWHGGEPLLLGKSSFRRLADAPRRRGVSHQIQTNATLLDEEWLGVLEPLIGRDGLGTSVEPFSTVRELPGRSYTERWLDSMRLLDGAGWRVGCVYVLCRRGLKHASELYWFFRNLRAGSALSLRVNPLLRVGRGRSTACDDIALDPGEYGAFLCELGREWLADHRRLVVEPLESITRAQAGEPNRLSCDLAGRAGCADGRLGIDAEGRLFGCGRAVDAGADTLGALDELGIEGALRNADRAGVAEREAALHEGPCGTCAHWRTCHGGCPHESHDTAGTAQDPTRLCTDYKRVFEWLESSTGRTAAGNGPGTRRGDATRPRPARRPPSDRLTAAPRSLRSWTPQDLTAAAGAPPERRVREPFAAAFESLERGGSPFHLPGFCEAGPAPRGTLELAGELLAQPCAVCPAWKTCRGYWLRPTLLEDHCRTWRTLIQDAQSGGVRRRAPTTPS